MEQSKATSSSSLARILLVEDNEADIRLIRVGLEKTSINNKLTVIKDGERAWQYIKGEGSYSDVELPDLILLDLNIPRKGGRELLKQIKSTEKFQHIPVIILSTSEAAKDVQYCYRWHANCFITKPLNLDRFLEVIFSIEKFWFSIAELPTHE